MSSKENTKSFKYIGEINFWSLRNAILDFSISNEDSILLHPDNFDDIVIEHRETYKEPFEAPFLFLDVLITEDTDDIVPKDRICILRTDTINQRSVNTEDDFSDIDNAFRCGWCGNIVDKDGYLLEGHERQRMINYLQKSEYSQTKHVDGLCCQHKRQM